MAPCGYGWFVERHSSHDANRKYEIKNDWIASNCGWTAFDGLVLDLSPFGTLINGNVVVWDNKIQNNVKYGKPLNFN